MKKINFLLIFVVCITHGYAQQNWFTKSSLDFGWQNVGEPGYIVLNTEYNQIAFDTVNNLPIIAFSDYTSLTGKATVMESNGITWWFYGNNEFSAGEADFVSLAISPQNLPYAAFQDWGNSKKATVMKSTAARSTWNNVGNAGFSDGPAFYTSLAFNPANGMPYIAYCDIIHNQKITVKKFDGNAWVDVGIQSFSAGMTKYVNLTFSSLAEPYVVFKDFAHNQKASVMKFNGTDWVYVGNPGVSPGQAEYTCIAFNPVDHLPYIAFEDIVNGSKVTTMKFDGTNWTYIGSPGFSAGGSEYLSLSVSKTGLLFVSFRDNSQSGNVSVMKFNGTIWANVGPPGFSLGESIFTHFALDKNGIPYVTFQLLTGPYPSATVMKYDSIIGGLRENNERKMVVYPNPAISQIYIECQDQNDKLIEIKVSDLKGIKCIDFNLNGNNCMLNTGDLSPGVYILEIQTRANIYFRKILKI